MIADVVQDNFAIVCKGQADTGGSMNPNALVVGLNNFWWAKLFWELAFKFFEYIAGRDFAFVLENAGGLHKLIFYEGINKHNRIAFLFCFVEKPIGSLFD